MSNLLANKNKMFKIITEAESLNILLKNMKYSPMRTRRLWKKAKGGKNTKKKISYNTFNIRFLLFIHPNVSLTKGFDYKREVIILYKAYWRNKRKFKSVMEVMTWLKHIDKYNNMTTLSFATGSKVLQDKLKNPESKHRGWETKFNKIDKQEKFYIDFCNTIMKGYK